MGKWLRSVSPSGYRAVDFVPELYPNLGTEKFDLVSDSPGLPSNEYDLIIHSHVMEHIPINLAYVMFHLSRALKPDGYHVFSIPISGGRHDEYFGPIAPKDATLRFGQRDHVRIISKIDFNRNIGAIMKLKTEYDMSSVFSSDVLTAANIPTEARTGLTGSTVFITRKTDYALSF